MSKNFSLALSLLATLAFVACGDSSSNAASDDSNSVNPDASNSVNPGSDRGSSDADISFDSFDDIFKCNAKREGKRAYIKDEKTLYTCEDGEWVETFFYAPSEPTSGSDLGSSSSDNPGSSSSDNPGSSSSVNPGSSSSVNPGSSSSVISGSSSSVIPSEVEGSSSSITDESSSSSSAKGGSSSSAKSDSSSSVNPGSSSSVISGSSSSVIPSEVEGSSSSITDESSSSSGAKGGSSSSAKSDSSSSVNPGSSSSVISGSSSSVIPSEVEGSSSSISDEGSSSSVESSSGLAEGQVDPATVIMGEMTDNRDGKTYKTVTIGTQTWMAENLNYVYPVGKFDYNGVTSDSISWCYDNDQNNCAKYGRLYTWSAAIDSAALFSFAAKECGFGDKCGAGGNIRGVCPSGWHMPSDMDWKKLFIAVGGFRTASTPLKTQTGWQSSSRVPAGTDSYGFSAIPAGYWDDFGFFKNKGTDGQFWTSTENDKESADTMSLSYNDEQTYIGNNYKNNAYSVRCIKD